MRVTRRVRPSQVGCGATIARRRLYAAIAAADVRTNISQAARIALIIEPDGEIVSATNSDAVIESRLYDSAPDLVASNASGW